MSLPPLGTHKSQLDTPVLCIDLPAMEANAREAAGLCREHKVAWRPHAKCHKSPDVARRLIDAGASGLTCAKLGEAEVFAAAGVHDLLIANMLVGSRKVERLVELRRKADPIVCIDHLDQATPISHAMAASGQRVRAVLEVDIGMHRVGIAPEAVVDLGRGVAALPGIELVGVMGYEGHLLLIEDQGEKAERIAMALATLTAAADRLRGSGIDCQIVSCGGTGSLTYSVRQTGITEVQAGGVIFMDAFYRHRCRVASFRYALKLIATVVSRPAPERAIIDAGRKAMNIELTQPLVMGIDEARIERLSAEHGFVELGPAARNVRIGDRLEIVPGYGDLTAMLHDGFHVLENDRLVDFWPLSARGKLT